MTGKERIMAALDRQEPDYTPTMEWILSKKVMKAAYGTEDDIEFSKIAGLDALAISLDGKNRAVLDGGEKFIDEWGITRALNQEYPIPVVHPIEEMSDFEAMEIPDPSASYHYQKIKRALKEVGEEKAIVGRVKDVVSMPRDLMGFEGFLESFYTQPELVTALMKMSCDYSCVVCDCLRDLGIKVIVLGDDIANNNSLLMSPAMYREMVLPHFAKLVQHAKKLGIKVIKHSDGDLNAIVEDLIGAGIDCLDPIDKRGHMNMRELKNKYGRQIAFKGNVDCVETLVSKPLAAVRQETAQAILEGGIGGGLIVSSSNSIHAGVNPENWKYFLEIRKELGRYPLDIASLEKIANEKIS
jgi:uroporphyrinogen decarboxylase